MQDLVISGRTLEELQLTPADLLIDLAVYLYDKERLSMGQAKKLACLTQVAFQREMADRGVLIKYDLTDLKQDLDALEQLD